MTRHTVALVGVVAFALVAWLGVGATWRAADQTPAMRSAVPTPDDPIAEGLRRQAARLKSYLESPPPLPPATRDPFRFGHRTSTPLTKTPADKAAPGSVGIEAPALAPELRLVGIAEDDAGGVAVRTAMVTVGEQLFLVKVGERLLQRYVVAKIGADAVELTDQEGGATLRLGLK